MLMLLASHLSNNFTECLLKVELMQLLHFNQPYKQTLNPFIRFSKEFDCGHVEMQPLF